MSGLTDNPTRAVAGPGGRYRTHPAPHLSGQSPGHAVGLPHGPPHPAHTGASQLAPGRHLQSTCHTGTCEVPSQSCLLPCSSGPAAPACSLPPARTRLPAHLRVPHLLCLPPGRHSCPGQLRPPESTADRRAWVPTASPLGLPAQTPHPPQSQAPGGRGWRCGTYSWKDHVASDTCGSKTWRRAGRGLTVPGEPCTMDLPHWLRDRVLSALKSL